VVADSKKIAYTDKRLNFWYVDVESGTPVKVDADRFEDPNVTLGVSWSPDSKWLTYSKFLESHLRSAFVYSLETGKVSQITAGLGDARYPVFDKSGREIFVAASTDLGLSSGWLDLSSYQHPVLRNVYAVVLKKGDKSPVEPESDEEKIADKDKKDEEKKDADKKDTDKKTGKKKDGDKEKEKEKDRDKD
jgi:tricorn protease